MSTRHLTDDFDLRPLQIAKHLRDIHGVEPKPTRKGYERETWHGQHELAHNPVMPWGDDVSPVAIVTKLIGKPFASLADEDNKLEDE